MTKFIEQNFEMDSYNIKSININFFKELYVLMDKYNIHRIYTAYLDKKKLIIAQQLLNVSIGNSIILKPIFDFLENNLKWIYFHICFRYHIFKYKLKLKKLFNKYGIEKIKSKSFNLYQGIHISDNSLYLREIELVFKDGQRVYIDALKLDI